MPGATPEAGVTKKRKRPNPEVGPSDKRNGKRGRTEKDAPHAGGSDEEILLLEGQILQSRKHYNGIATLLRYCQDRDGQEKRSITAAVALCRIFCHLLAAGNLSKPQEALENEITIVQWLRAQLESYRGMLLGLFSAADPAMQSTALTLLMRLLKGESESLNQNSDDSWRIGAFPSLVLRVVSTSTADSIREEFVEKYLQPYDDVRYYAFAALNDISACSPSDAVLDNVISVLAILDSNVAQKEHIDSFYVVGSQQVKQRLKGMTAHKKQAQELWLKILRGNLSKSRRKTILGLVTQQIAPWFTRIELLMDFLSDSFNAGGSTSLAALSGLFHLIREKNLDYPRFYVKLYTLLTTEILHSKHRSRFFRLLDTFLFSTHLPAALVASFIKRLARLSLSAPPSGIVVVVPWIYNLLKNHPSCTFMIHRKAENSRYTIEHGMNDPFDMEEPDPMKTNAIDSSLWEIHTLQSHYHPNVATIAKIISEQFTKQAYNLEDFLDHSYTSMLNAELSKEIKKPPVVEYEIPKKIFLRYEELPRNSLLANTWDFI